MRRALVVVAHPDDESFGLGALLAALAAQGAEVDLLCFTRGEASTLGATGHLADIRATELAAAGEELGLHHVALLEFGDGALALADAASLDERVERELDGVNLMVMFEPAGVTGHGDHRAATAAALRVARRHHLATLEWGLQPGVAATLRTEFGVPFSALEGPEVHDVQVDRTRQSSAMACHSSQSTDNPVLRRRLELQGCTERVRFHRGSGRG